MTCEQQGTDGAGLGRAEEGRGFQPSRRSDTHTHRFGLSTSAEYGLVRHQGLREHQRGWAKRRVSLRISKLIW